MIGKLKLVEQGIAYRNVWIKNGNLKFTSGKGIDFSATANANGSLLPSWTIMRRAHLYQLQEVATTAGTTTYSYSCRKICKNR